MKHTVISVMVGFNAVCFIFSVLGTVVNSIVSFLAQFALTGWLAKPLATVCKPITIIGDFFPVLLKIDVVVAILLLVITVLNMIRKRAKCKREVNAAASRAVAAKVTQLQQQPIQQEQMQQEQIKDMSIFDDFE